MNIYIVFEITEKFEDSVVHSVWDTEEKAYTMTETLFKEGRIAYYEGYPVLECEPKEHPHSFDMEEALLI